MTTECTPTQLKFHSIDRREIVGPSTAETSLPMPAVCFCGRSKDVVESFVGLHRVLTICGIRIGLSTRWRNWSPQRIYGLALGYEDLNDHDELRSDPLLAGARGKERNRRGKTGFGHKTKERRAGGQRVR